MTHYISRIRIKNFRGLEFLDVEIPPAGAIFKGSNGKGKTSAINAIRAALAARDVGPDAIRIGAEKAEILIDADDLTIRRLITPKTSSVRVENAAGDQKRAPQTFLKELLGSSPLDPLDLYLAKPAEQREMVLKAMPIRCTIEDLWRWIPEHLRDRVNLMLAAKSFQPMPLETSHGLDVVDLFHGVAYELRREANAEAARLEAQLGAKREDIQTRRAKLDMTLAETGATVDIGAARARLSDLQAKDARAGQQAESLASLRERIASIRDEARCQEMGLQDPAILRARLDTHYDREHAHLQRLSEARRAFEEAKRRVEDLEKTRDDLYNEGVEQKKMLDRVEQAKKIAAEKRERADELERTMVHMADVAPTREEIDAALAAVDVAARAADEAAKLAAIISEEEAIQTLNQEAFEASELAADLNDVVERLRVDAPKELLAAQNGIRGLAVTDDGVTLDGVAIGSLCGAEQMRFAVEVARRSNPKSKILIVDGIERIADDRLEDFIREATSDGYQLIASRVDRGELVVEAIGQTAEAAE